MSLYFIGLRLTNFMPFRGEHQIDLGPGVFALVAEREGDPRRSNAQGKSALLWALRFALTGDHPKRTEDEWLTDGEREGGVDVELSDGTFVSRWRTRGEATRLKVVVDDIDRIQVSLDGNYTPELELHGDEAQKRIDHVVGLSKTEQSTTWWCEQGRADAFVNGDPGETTADVVRWCGVEPVRRAAKGVADELAELLKSDARLLAESDAALQQIAEFERVHVSIGKIDLAIQSKRAALADLEAVAGRDRNAALLDAQYRKLEANASERAALVVRATELEADARQKHVDGGALAAAKTSFEVALAKHADADQKTKLKLRLAVGKFSGLCPVGGIQCPVTDDLNSRATENRGALEKAEALQSTAAGKLASARNHVNDLERIEREGAKIAGDLKAVRERIDRLTTPPEIVERTAELSGNAPFVERAATEIAERLQRARGELQSLEGDLEQVKRTTVSANTIRDHRAKLAPDITARREALQILGPSGAQRRLVDGFLNEVQDSAAEDLALAGVDLAVTFEWQRELKDPATACANCGQPFPASTRVKACEHCGAQRGRKIEQKLRCLVEPKSGGMDALAGVGVRLAALAWLKARRHSSWSVVALDEPLAAVDQHNRMLIGRHLVAMLGGHYGIEQAFVSAHDPALLAALPRRIVVSGSDRGSTVKVVA